MLTILYVVVTDYTQFVPVCVCVWDCWAVKINVHMCQSFAKKLQCTYCPLYK